MKIIYASHKYSVFSETTSKDNFTVGGNEFTWNTTPRGLLNSSILKLTNFMAFNYVDDSERRVVDFCNYLSAFTGSDKLTPDKKIAIVSVDAAFQQAAKDILEKILK